MVGRRRSQSALKVLGESRAATRSPSVNPRVGGSHGDIAQALALAVFKLAGSTDSPGASIGYEASLIREPEGKSIGGRSLSYDEVLGRVSVVHAANRVRRLAALVRLWAPDDSRTLFANDQARSRMARAADLPASDESPVVEELRPVPFEELVRTHYEAMREEFMEAEDRAAYRAYEVKRARFEAFEGTIVLEWWGVSAAAGVVMTVRPTPLHRRVVGEERGAQLHRWTDFLTHEVPRIAAALTTADDLAIRCREILMGSSQRVALAHVFGAATSLLGVIDSQKTRGYPMSRPDVAEYVSPDEDKNEREERERRTREREDRDRQEREDRDRQEREERENALREFSDSLKSGDAYYRAAAARATQIFYFWGMIVGLAVIAVLTAVVALVVDTLLSWNGIEVDPGTFALMLTAVAFGGVGACVSAMWRISSGDFYADYEAGSTHSRMIGSFRPFIGAVFGLALYIAWQAGFLPALDTGRDEFYLAALIAFLGGFSERLAPDVFAKAAEGVSGSGAER